MSFFCKQQKTKESTYAKIIRIVLIFLSFFIINGYAAEKTQFLGVLEELPQKKIDDTGKTQDTYLRQIRVVFYKDGQEWKTPPKQYPSETTWTIAFDGKNLGEIKGQKKSDEENKKDSGWLDFQQINAGAQKAEHPVNLLAVSHSVRLRS